MKTRKEPENPEIVETAEVAEAPGAEPKEEITFPENCVYCGPSVKGVAKQYTVYTGGNIPAPLRDFVQQHPAARGAGRCHRTLCQDAPAAGDPRNGRSHAVSEGQI